MSDITRKTDRAKLKARREPYWLKLRDGGYLGFRAGPGTWIVRYRDRAGKQNYSSLGEGSDYPDAKAQAEKWLDMMMSGHTRKPSRGTVRDALCTYVRHLRSIGRRRAAWDAGKRFRLTVNRNSEFGTMKLEDITKQDVEAWRERLRKGRLPRTVNRNVRNVVAGLNVAVKRGHIGNREAWRLEHLVDDGEENVAVFLTAEQRDKIIATAPKPLANLLTGYTHTGARPSELAKATVADFDAKGGTVTLRHYKGRGGKLRPRAVMLSDTGAAFFHVQARGKLPTAPLISNDTGGHWSDQQWCAGIERAIIAVNSKAKKPAQRIPKGASAYSFRHTRISELLQVYGVDPLTVAAQTGTGLNMIERYYFKFISSSMKNKLNAVKAS